MAPHRGWQTAVVVHRRAVAPVAIRQAQGRDELSHARPVQEIVERTGGGSGIDRPGVDVALGHVTEDHTWPCEPLAERAASRQCLAWAVTDGAGTRGPESGASPSRPEEPIRSAHPVGAERARDSRRSAPCPRNVDLIDRGQKIALLYNLSLGDMQLRDRAGCFRCDRNFHLHALENGNDLAGCYDVSFVGDNLPYGSNYFGPYLRGHMSLLFLSMLVCLVRCVTPQIRKIRPSFR